MFLVGKPKYLISYLQRVIIILLKEKKEKEIRNFAHYSQVEVVVMFDILFVNYYVK